MQIWWTCSCKITFPPNFMDSRSFSSQFTRGWLLWLFLHFPLHSLHHVHTSGTCVSEHFLHVHCLTVQMYAIRFCSEYTKDAGIRTITHRKQARWNLWSTPSAIQVKTNMPVFNSADKKINIVIGKMCKRHKSLFMKYMYTLLQLQKTELFFFLFLSLLFLRVLS